ncbi:hypothetical protein RZE82_03830 [Mollicutes bacterium LVI A0039]|nr:hypothetical protein RZE82_03830 [Mollicutes bacterium LVI A0039]
MEDGKNEFVKSDIVFKDGDAYCLNEIKPHFEVVSKRERTNYKIFVMCAYIGIKMTSKNRRILIDTDQYLEEKVKDFDMKRPYSIPRPVLMQNDMELKRLLFAVGINANKNNLDAKELQKLWNEQELSQDNEYYKLLRKHVSDGAKILFNYLVIQKESPLAVNETIFEILTKEFDDIVLSSEYEPSVTIDETEGIKSEKLTDVSIDDFFN